MCTGDGLCSEICSELFGPHDTGLWHVKEAFWPDIYNGQKGVEPIYSMSTGLALVTPELLETAVEAAEECPGSCIFLEVAGD